MRIGIVHSKATIFSSDHLGSLKISTSRGLTTGYNDVKSFMNPAAKPQDVSNRQAITFFIVLDCIMRKGLLISSQFPLFSIYQGASFDKSTYC